MTLRHTASHQVLPLQAVGRSIRMVRTAPEDTKDWAVATPAPTKKSAAVRRTRLMETLSRRSLTRILHLTADDADDASRRSRNEASQGVRRCGDGGPWSAASKPKDGNGDAGSALASMSGRSGRRRNERRRRPRSGFPRRGSGSTTPQYLAACRCGSLGTTLLVEQAPRNFCSRLDARTSHNSPEPLKARVPEG